MFIVVSIKHCRSLPNHDNFTSEYPGKGVQGDRVGFACVNEFSTRFVDVGDVGDELT